MVKHSGCSAAWATFTLCKKEEAMTISHDGAGLNGHGRSNGVGASRVGNGKVISTGLTILAPVRYMDAIGVGIIEDQKDLRERGIATKDVRTDGSCWTRFASWAMSAATGPSLDSCSRGVRKSAQPGGWPLPPPQRMQSAVSAVRHISAPEARRR
jgi:hypothetical protein